MELYDYLNIPTASEGGCNQGRYTPEIKKKKKKYLYINILINNVSKNEKYKYFLF